MKLKVEKLADNISRSKILVCMHVYYHEMCRELLDCLSNLKGLDFDLYVTLNDDTQEIRNEIKAFKDDAVILKVDNKGYDVGPFCEVLKLVDLDQYDYLIKLHTKRNFMQTGWINGFDVSLDKWRNRLLSFIRTRDKLDTCLEAFKSDPTIGMIGNYGLISTFKTSSHRKDYSYLCKTSGELLQKAGLTPYPEKTYSHVAGTMFIARAKLFKPMQKLGLGSESFAAVQRGTIMDMAHVVEIFQGRLITSQIVPEKPNEHYRIADPFTSFEEKMNVGHFLHYAYKHRNLKKLFRFICRHDLCTQDGKLYNQLRVFKIPVHKTEIIIKQ